MRHGSVKVPKPRSEDIEQWLVDLSEEFLSADPERRNAIGEEFEAIVGGRVIPFGAVSRSS